MKNVESMSLVVKNERPKWHPSAGRTWKEHLRGERIYFGSREVRHVINSNLRSNEVIICFEEARFKFFIHKSSTNVKFSQKYIRLFILAKKIYFLIINPVKVSVLA